MSVPIHRNTQLRWGILLDKKHKLKKPLRKTRGRKRKYSSECLAPLIVVWMVLDLACGKRVAAAMGKTLDALLRFGELDCPSDVVDKLKQMSASTIDRLLAVQHKTMCFKGRSTTKPGTLLKHDIPIRLGNEWDGDKPGYVEMDTVAHCGDSARGQYVVTLDVTDIKSTWSEQQACLNKAQRHVFFRGQRDTCPAALQSVWHRHRWRQRVYQRRDVPLLQGARNRLYPRAA